MDSNNTPENEAETAVQNRVDAVIDDMAKGRVVPRNLDRIEVGVNSARRDQAANRALNKRFVA